MVSTPFLDNFLYGRVERVPAGERSVHTFAAMNNYCTYLNPDSVNLLSPTVIRC